MSSSDASGSRPRGRPVEIDPGHLSAVAVELFRERGYDDVSAAEVAAVAGVSRRSLFRYFPSKADLVWEGFADGLEVLAVALLANGQVAPAEAVVRAVLTAAERTPPAREIRTRLRLIAAHPELMAVGVGRLAEQIRICAAYLGTRGVHPLTAEAQAAAITAAAFTGYLHWALRSPDEAPLATVRQSLAALGELDRPR